MTTDEIIQRLKELKTACPAVVDDIFSPGEISADCEALTAAIQAVETVAAVNAAMEEKDCSTCYFCDDPKGKDALYSSPCYGCKYGDNNWRLRWPLKDAST